MGKVKKIFLTNTMIAPRYTGNGSKKAQNFNKSNESIKFTKRDKDLQIVRSNGYIETFDPWHLEVLKYADQYQKLKDSNKLERYLKKRKEKLLIKSIKAERQAKKKNVKV